MFWLEVIGVAAFSVCGAMAALEKSADIFGVLFLAVITALGGGVVRDMMLGHLPPRMFTSYTYIIVAITSGLIVFLDAYTRREHYRQNREKLDSIVNVFDALGLGVFSVSGVQVAIDQCGLVNPVLLVSMGMTTGVGGGMMRDVLAGVMPKVLRKRVYAVASLIGALGYYALIRQGVNANLSAALMTLLVMALRIAATVFKWNLPQAKV